MEGHAWVELRKELPVPAPQIELFLLGQGGGFDPFVFEARPATDRQAAGNGRPEGE